MALHYGWKMFFLFCAAMAQCWVTGILLLVRQIELLLLGNIGACVFWFWCAWISFLYKKKLGMLWSTLWLITTLLLTGVCMLYIVDDSGLNLLVDTWQ